MGKKVIAIASADWHIHRFKQFNDTGVNRLDWGLKMVSEIADACRMFKVPLLFPGDLIHNPKEVENVTITRFLNTYYKEFEKFRVPFLGISGNHDLSEKNTLKHKSPSYLHGLDGVFNTFTCLDNRSTILDVNFSNRTRVVGIPFMNNDYDLVGEIKKQTAGLKESGFKRNILMLHSDFPGAKTPSGYEIAETQHIPKDLNIFFKDWDLVICGHIHKAQQLAKNVYMLGSPIQLDRGQAKEKCGYWKIYEDFTMKFHELRNFPKFIYLKKGETAYNDKDFFILPEAIKEDVEASKKEFALSNTRKQLAKNYCTLKGVEDREKRIALINVLNEV